MLFVAAVWETIFDSKCIAVFGAPLILVYPGLLAGARTLYKLQNLKKRPGVRYIYMHRKQEEKGY